MSVHGCPVTPVAIQRTKHGPRRRRDRDPAPAPVSTEISDLDPNAVNFDDTRFAYVIPVDAVAHLVLRAIPTNGPRLVGLVRLVSVHDHISAGRKN
jgi:hypothetical protein